MTTTTERKGWRRAVRNTERPPRPMLLSFVLFVDAAWVLGLLFSELPETLLFAPLFALAFGLIYLCKEMNPIALRLRGAVAVMALVGAIGWAKTGDLSTAAIVGCWGLLGALGCWAAWSAYRRPAPAPGPEGEWGELLKERPARGRLASAWDEAPPRPFALTVIVVADALVLVGALIGTTVLFADREGGFGLSITALLLLATVDILAWQMHRFGLIARAGLAIVLVLAAAIGPGPLTGWMLVAVVHAVAVCAAVGLALRILGADRTERDPRRAARARGTVECPPCEVRRS